jgi:hypothetical protein
LRNVNTLVRIPVVREENHVLLCHSRGHHSKSECDQRKTMPPNFWEAHGMFSLLAIPETAVRVILRDSPIAARRLV